MKRLEGAELRLKRSKYRFMVPSLTYLGHLIDFEGLHPVKEKVRAVEEAPCQIAFLS